MDNEVYKTPQSELLGSSAGETYVLASRWSRFGASFLDGLCIGVITIPLMYFTGGFDGVSKGVQPSWQYSLSIGLVGIVAFFLLNYSFLSRNGQTIGKKIVGVRIVDLENNVPTIKKHLLPRYMFYFLPGQIPVVGSIVSMVNILFIFGKQKRCVHDYVAGTKVISC